MAGATADTTRLSLTLILVPMSRGILAAIVAPMTATLRETPNPETVLQVTRDDTYGATGSGEGLVQLLPGGSQPITGTVLGSGTTTVQVTIDRGAEAVVVMCAIDSLDKDTTSAVV